MSDIIDQIPEIPSGASSVAPGTQDRKGNPFDSARHIAKMSKAGTWMPKSPGRGGHKPKTAAPSSGSTSSQPVSTATATPEHSTPSSASRADSPAPSLFEEIDRAAAAAGASAEKTEAAAGVPTSGDASLPAEAAGEIGARAVYAITGAVIGNHKVATASGAEHKNIAAVFTAYARHRGWAVVGPLALLGTLVAYLLTDGRREPLTEMIKKFFASKKKAPVSVTPESEPIDITPAPAAAAPAVESVPFEKI